MNATITIKQLHAKTGEHVRRAGNSQTPVPVTDRGRLVAVLARPNLFPVQRRKRRLLPEYATLLAKPLSRDVLVDVAAVRGER